MEVEGIKFSIIVPTFNRAHLIKDAIESIVEQTYPYWELIVCDDASFDNTKELILSFQDDRIKYIKLDSNQGNAAARNLGVKTSLHEWITFIDSDDQYDPEYLSEFAREINNNPAFYFFFCGYRVVKNDQAINKLIWRPDNTSRGSFLRDLKIGIGCGVVIHRQCFDRVGLFDARLRASVDTDFLIRLEMKYPFCIVNKVLISINVHDGPRVRKNAINMMEAYQFIVEKNKPVIWADKGLLKRWYYKLMWLQFHANNIRGGNESYQVLRDAQCVNSKARFIHALFNVLPVPVALFIHKKLAV